MPTDKKVYIVYMGQGFKYAIAELLKKAGANPRGSWYYTDSSTTEIGHYCSFKGTAEELQQAIWDIPTYGSVAVAVKAVPGKR